MRRVVTGKDARGKSVFVSDEDVAPITPQLMPGSSFCQLWGSDDAVSLPCAGDAPKWSTFFPPETGFRFLVWTLPPEGNAPGPDVDVAAGVAEVQRLLPGLVEHTEPDNPGMHTTQTIDWDYIVSGEVWLELDDGAEVHLVAGDSVIQNGTRHAWRNRTNAPAVVVTALVGARLT